MPNKPLRNCMNCGHRKREQCVLTGYEWEIQRQFPGGSCDRNLSGWVERNSSQDVEDAVATAMPFVLAASAIFFLLFLPLFIPALVR
jgi:hypothetical protein